MQPLATALSRLGDYQGRPVVHLGSVFSAAEGRGLMHLMYTVGLVYVSLRNHALLSCRADADAILLPPSSSATTASGDGARTHMALVNPWLTPYPAGQPRRL